MKLIKGSRHVQPVASTEATYRLIFCCLNRPCIKNNAVLILKAISSEWRQMISKAKFLIEMFCLFFAAILDVHTWSYFAAAQTWILSRDCLHFCWRHIVISKGYYACSRFCNFWSLVRRPWSCADARKTIECFHSRGQRLYANLLEQKKAFT